MEGSEEVSPEEFAKWFEVFSFFDEDGSASIKTSVLGHVVRGLDRMPSEELLKVGLFFEHASFRDVATIAFVRVRFE